MKNYGILWKRWVKKNEKTIDSSYCTHIHAFSNIIKQSNIHTRNSSMSLQIQSQKGEMVFMSVNVNNFAKYIEVEMQWLQFKRWCFDNGLKPSSGDVIVEYVRGVLKYE
jgi:hypothetical protein